MINGPNNAKKYLLLLFAKSNAHLYIPSKVIEQKKGETWTLFAMNCHVITLL